MNNDTAVVAFSGGLDTSYLVPFTKEHYGIKRVITCAVDTGGFSEDERNKIAARAAEVGSDKHVHVNAEQEFHDEILKYMIFGNITRDGYPMCVGSERLVQARLALELALQENARYVFHGSTGAGNDQYRFDCVVHVLGQGKVEPVAPIREHNISREQSTAFLREKGIGVPDKAKYSYNVGLWGVSIGGEETHESLGLIPEAAWYSQPADIPAAEVEIQFEEGTLSRLITAEGQITGPVEIIKALAKLGSQYAIGRHYYTGTSIPGKKGRLAYESPAADIIYAAHRCLEQITLSSAQVFGKQTPANDFGRLVHEAKMFDPYLDDLKALLISTQRRVTGRVLVGLDRGIIGPVRADSPHNLLTAAGARYGEVSEFYSGAQAEGAAKLHSFEQKIWRSRE